MLDYLLKKFFLLLIINSIVLIHELGHYLFARFFSVDVQLFYIGFGTPLFKYKDSNGTIWALCSIPFGGYVSLVENDLGSKKGFNSLHPLKSFLIAFAGPFFNFLLFFILYFFVFLNLNSNISILFQEANLHNHNLSNIGVIECIQIAFERISFVFKNILSLKLVGPIKIITRLNNVLEHGLISMLYYVANLSLFLGLCNLIPLPILDGGMMLISLYSLVFKRGISEKTYLILTYLSILFIGAIFFSLCLIEFNELFEYIRRVK